MTELKTQKNDASVDKYLAGIKDEQRHADCLAVLELMQAIKRLEDAHLPTLKKLIMKAYKSPAIAGATIS